MSLSDWATVSKERFERDGIRIGAYGAVQELWQGGLGLIGEHVYNYGTHVFEDDWDVLFILDTCRPDVLAEVADEYDVLQSYDEETDYINSVGSRSPEWIDKTFDFDEYGEELSKTAYVSANPHSKDIKKPERLGLLDEVWRYRWDEDLSTVGPDTMVDRAIDVWRSNDVERMIVHLMQPHSPYRSLLESHPHWFKSTSQVGPDDEDFDMVIWERLRTGRLSRDKHWAAYRDNVRWVMDSIEVALENMDAETVVLSSDHGEAFGEWWCYGHSSRAPIPVLKQVPWVETSATDTGEYEPSIEPDSDAVVTDENVSERLRNLGYL